MKVNVLYITVTVVIKDSYRYLQSQLIRILGVSGVGFLVMIPNPKRISITIKPTGIKTNTNGKAMLRANLVAFIDVGSISATYNNTI